MRERERESSRVEEENRRETVREEEREDRELPPQGTHNNSGVFAVKQGDDSDSYEEDGPEAFEDDPMPIFKSAIRISDGNMKVKILIDSGAAISLISKGTADRLVRAGAKIEREGNLRIKVASGERALINKTITLPIRMGGQWTNSH